MRELALFAGAGGGILGGLILGWRTVCAVELDPYCRRVLLARQRDGHLPRFPIWDDVCTFDGRPWCGHVDIISGGFPCQDISCAGKGAGITSKRSGLWAEFVRIIREVGPRFVFVENSPMLTSRGLGVVLGDLAEMGFDARWGVLGACCAGLPIERQRLWILAHGNGPHCHGWPKFTLGDVGCKSGKTSKSGLREFERAIGWCLSEEDHSRLRRNPDVLASWMDRLRAIGNGQVPAVAALAWNTLSKCQK